MIEASSEDLELMKFFNALRVQSEKIGPVNDDMLLEIKVPEEIIKELDSRFPVGGDVSLTIETTESEADEEKIANIQPHIEEEHISFSVRRSDLKIVNRFKEFGEVPSAELCDEYYKIQEKMVFESFIRFHASVKVSIS